MRIEEFAVLGREDLKQEYKNASINIIIENVYKTLIPLSKNKMHKFNIIFFIDNNGDVFVIKNRYGRNSKDYLESLHKQLEISQNKVINAETFIKNLSKKKWWQLFGVRKKCKKYINGVLNMYGSHV